MNCYNKTLLKYFQHKKSKEIARVYEDDTWEYYSKLNRRWESTPFAMIGLKNKEWSKSLFPGVCIEINEKEAFIEML